ncbi:MAG: phosphotransferase, partial [Alphaproteobacteria bacterium]|nr:phosphotransferase [Alphaproteobacteria bacterium]
MLAVGDAGGPVVKVWDDLLGAERCAATLRMAGHRASAIVPRVIAVLPDPPAVVMERVEGKMWAQSLNAGEAGSIERARRVGEALALLHRATTNTPVIPDHLERFRAYHLKKAALRLGAGGRSPEIRRVAAAVITACAAQRRCLAHGDLTLLNVIVAPDRIAFVDFDMAWYGDPAFDLGMLAGSLIGGHLVAATAP